MIVYWLLLIGTVGLTMLVRKKKAVSEFEKGLSLVEYRPRYISFLLVLIPLIVLCGLRTEFADTKNYIINFEKVAGAFTFENLDVEAPLYTLLSRFCKAFLFQKGTTWVLFLTALSVLMMIPTLLRYSPDLSASMFVFIASTEFASYLMNGARQFLAVCLCFFAFDFMLKRKPIPYFLLILLASTIHLTALIMIPAYFFVDMKPYSLSMYIAVVAAWILCVFSQPLMESMFNITLFEEVYGHYKDAVFSYDGVNVLRTLTHCAPVILCWIFRSKIMVIDNKALNCCVILSLVNAVCFVFSSTIGGNLTGRIAEYFTIFNLLLYPMLFQRVIPSAWKPIIKTAFILFFVVFFYYQMGISWHAQYISSVLGVRC